MKYYVIEIAEGDAKIRGKSISEFATLREAQASFHKKLGTALGSDLYTKELIMCVDDDAVIYNVEHIEKEN